MSKLPVVSGAECVKALEKIGFVVNRQRRSHTILVRQEPKTTVTVHLARSLQDEINTLSA